MELTAENLKVVTNSTKDSVEEVNKVHAHGKYRCHGDAASHHKTVRRNFDESQQNGKICKFCGKEHVFKKSSCPAWGMTCKECKGENHLASFVPKKKAKKPKSKLSKKKVNAVYADYSCENEYYSDSTEGSITGVL